MFKKTKYLVIVFSLVLTYLLLGTGLHGDDYIAIEKLSAMNLSNYLTLDIEKLEIMSFNIVTYYTFWWAYFILGFENQWIYDLIKIVTHIISVYFVYKFFQDYLSKDRAFLASILFILYPLHDTTAYWYMTNPYIFIPSILLYSHHLIRKNKIQLGFPILTLGAFSYYVSLPYVFGLAAIFVFEKRFKKAMVFAIPGLFYIAYYFWIKLNFPGVERRISSDLSIIDFTKQMLVQILSFIESSIGLSYWLKVLFSISSISLVSIVIVAFIALYSILKVPCLSAKNSIPKSLYLGIISILILSFGMFALTGLYSHSAFNLGNRATVYGSLLIALLLSTLLPANKKSVIFLLLIFIMPVFGLSDHWKSWNSNQKAIIENIQNNQELKEIERDSTLIVTGNIYSKLGLFSHIEFFSMPWNVDTIFKESVRSENIVALTPYIILKDNYLIDPKFGGRYSLLNKLYVYNSKQNSVEEIYASDVPQLISKQPRIVRHWVQLFKDTWIQDSIVRLSPRLDYLFQ
jgi:hypothetical protein